MHKALATVLAVAVMAATFAARTADAAPKQKQPPPRERSDASPSRDGRVLGRPRTCGHDYFLYDGDGTPIGPYCH